MNRHDTIIVEIVTDTIFKDICDDVDVVSIHNRLIVNRLDAIIDDFGSDKTIKIFC
ncbi:ORF-145 peptide [Chrysodeixis chalcites nucleopolyhedrovirus]|uniref:ORF-145 peptide n=1 Tax=Chrysodeixis chalcites nucleopolyhedrovirus TaxID=320432 RepID=Q4KST6_9ABAC|nr:ORF-145 peptide [Chrysodeixis chalcites nucleopolyhedrovirus]AGC36358.1 hypothetical protein TF1A_00145 [Chrysodeixis chalcites SNPV TF1-A]AAY84076.1 ORF-145 peptide [Chrysodeixis chalcites nucleopolyhedrovirus]AGE61404.1 hypothetical protein [Chrysodeixis chalcites nucleopolyhedrovirus]AGE61560.1 hypothetical protein [Chrysodeixis chalcites nucleopolyhedrovirus]AGE61705.1 hypothetical protein [Chrysodeixis chalcites nucleopolyhedrovirus]